MLDSGVKGGIVISKLPLSIEPHVSVSTLVPFRNIHFDWVFLLYNLLYILCCFYKLIKLLYFIEM